MRWRLINPVWWLCRAGASFGPAAFAALVLAVAPCGAFDTALAGQETNQQGGWTAEVQTPKTVPSAPIGRAVTYSAAAKVKVVAAKESKPAATSAAAPATASKAAEKYCRNIADAAADARFAWQKNTLETLKRELKERIDRLQAKTAEYRKWLARRDEFSKRAQGALVLIYAKMRPDVAAQQLIAMDRATAASLLMKLKPTAASAMLNEMAPAKAARLAAIIAGAARIDSAPADQRSRGAKQSSIPKPRGVRR